MGIVDRVFIKLRNFSGFRLSKDRLVSREEFVRWAIQLATGQASTPRILEIGPYMSPLVVGENVDTFDVLTREELVLRAISEGGPSHLIPDVTWIGPEASSEFIHARYDLILSSHVVEHQIDLIAHFQNISSLLNSGGFYAALIPDHRYCFDHFNSPSTISEVLEAHLTKKTNHSLKNFLEDRLTTGHNVTLDYWKNDFGSPKIFDKSVEEIWSIFAEYKTLIDSGTYIDIHAWKFTDKTFLSIFESIKSLNFVKLEIRVCIPAKFGNNEFWVLFHKI
jgi:hypothetical protein